MATKTSGKVLERHWKRGRGYALRFSAYGKRRYLTLGFERDGWTLERAEEELANVMADVRRGIWVPPKKDRGRAKPGEEEIEVPIFGPFASDLVAARRGEVAQRTIENAEWALGYTLDFFADWTLPEIDVQAVDDFRRHMMRLSESRRLAIERRKPLLDENGNPLRPLAPRTINMTIDFLRWVLSIAREYGHITENPAVGKRRRLKTERKPPVHLDSASQIEAVLRAAGELDQNLRFLISDRLAAIATLIFAGPRAHELCHLLWRDVDIAAGRIFIGRSKTQAGLREIKLMPILRDILSAHKANAYRSGPDDLVFPTGTGGMRDRNNLRSAVLGPAFDRASELLVANGEVPLPKGLSTHKLRHTFASVLIACGEDPISLMTQIGHTDPGFTLRVYAHMMNRDPEERARLKALVKGERSIVSVPTRGLRSRDYEQPILRALADLGGSATRREIADQVHADLAPRMTPVDLDRVPSGMQRWQTHLSKARANLIHQGVLRADSSRGSWELDQQAVQAK
ncbi:MAG: tyrosine-type recombinase/integrase [Solirubrobacterales bacterium]|nr:tyrosine-type recombinase/integrase [Solirubrobacterales bacterium]